MSKKGKTTFAVYPHLHHLIIFAMCGVILCTALCIYYLYASGSDSVDVLFTENWPSLIIVLCPVAVFFAVSIHNGYDYFGKIYIDDSQIICRAPLKKPLYFKYSEIREIGCDYAWLSGERQYWIYLCIDKLPNKYIHKINRMPIGQNQLRIQFSEDVFHTLLAHLPNDLMKHYTEVDQAIFRTTVDYDTLFTGIHFVCLD